MAKKMYYSEDEAAAKLGVTIEQLTDYARQGKLQQYRDGARKVYKSEQVDALAAPAVMSLDDTGEIELAPADSTAGDSVSLADAELTKDTGKEDTVITAEGISIFDDEDLEVDTADPMAKTQISPTMEDQMAIEGVGSGSGLLDLTRESDDTSLGAEVLDHIDMESSVMPGLGDSALGESGLGESALGESALGESALGESALGVEVPAEFTTTAPVETAAEQPLYVDQVDPGAGLFNGFLVGSALVALLLAVVAVGVPAGVQSGLTGILKGNMAVVIGVAAAVVAACGVVGMLVGKSASMRQTARR